MDDFNMSSLHESKNEWGARLITILTPFIIDGFRSILDEAYKLCKENNELEKYLMTYQNFICRIPKWNPTIIEQERLRIIEKSGCNYLEDLVTCVHIIQLKILTAMRVGQKQKKIDINIPKLDDFIHKIYINAARVLYQNVYLFEKGIAPLNIQKHNREIEIIVQECILNTLRESIPVEAILKAYMDETIEENVVEEIKEQIIEDSTITPTESFEEKHDNVKYSEDTIISDYSNKNSKLSFNDTDYIKDEDNNEIKVQVPKTIEHLEEISEQKNFKRKLESEDDDDNVKLNISDQHVELNGLDIHNIIEPDINLLPDLLIDDIEILE
jgi:hypothetical protein